MIYNQKHLKPREKLDLPPRLFRQLLNPNRPNGFSQDLLAYDKEQFSQRVSVPARSFEHCICHFWDDKAKRAVSFDLGSVWVNARFSYRVAPSLPVISFGSECPDDEPANILSREEGATPCELSAGEYRAQRSEHGTESAVKSQEFPTNQQGQICSGSYVIPGQTLTD